MLTIHFLIVLVLLLVCFDDVKTRTIKHRYILALLVLVLFGWARCPNLAVLPYSFLILLIGFGLHFLRILGAGDTKLLFVISLGVSPSNLSLLFFGIAFFSVPLVAAYLVIASVKGMAYVRRKGLPFALPISCAGMLALLVSSYS